MCGRYYLDLNNLLNEEYELSGEITYETNFNITPQSQVPIIIENKLIIGTWGYYPEWLKKQKNSKPLFNTRWETIQEKRTFQTAFKKHRCLVPISGWYEWKNVDNEKHPYFFHNEKNILKLQPFIGKDQMVILNSQSLLKKHLAPWRLFIIELH